MTKEQIEQIILDDQTMTREDIQDFVSKYQENFSFFCKEIYTEEERSLIAETSVRIRLDGRERIFTVIVEWEVIDDQTEFLPASDVAEILSEVEQETQKIKDKFES